MCVYIYEILIFVILKYCYIFKKCLNLSLLIASKVKPNMCLVSIKLFIVRTILCPTVQTYTTYTTITTTIIVCTLQLFCKQQHLFVRSVWRRSSNHDCSLHTTRLRTRLTEFLLFACFVLHFYMLKWSVWLRFLKWNVRTLAFSRILLRLHLCLCYMYTVLVATTLLCVLFIYLLHTHSDVVVSLLITSSM